MTSLNPTYTIGHQLMEAILLHTNRNKQQAYDRAVEMLHLVNINEPKKRMTQYPYELSGGMRQRVMIAMALACEPDILIADEPTGNIDPELSYEIVELLDEINKTGTTILMVTHEHELVNRFHHRTVTLEKGRVIRDTGGTAHV